MTQFTIETLIKGKAKKSNTDKWYPTPVEKYREILKIKADTESQAALLKNLSYNLQYMEFLQKELDELELSSVLHAMLIKTYVITGMSILEGIFAYVVKENGWWPKKDSESLSTFSAEGKDASGEKIRVKTELSKVIPKTDLEQYEINLDSLIKILNKHHEGLQIDHVIYPALQRTRQLRNKIHLTCTKSYTDHDYNAFDDETKQNIQNILYEILTSEKITTEPECFEFLKK